MGDNINIENIDNTPLSGANAEFKDDTLNLAGADTIAKGTILARDSVSLKLVLFVKGGGVNENGIPKAVMTSELIVTGGGDSQVRPQISGDVKLSQLIIDADGSGVNIDDEVIDQLRDYGLLAQASRQLSKFDNPQP